MVNRKDVRYQIQCPVSFVLDGRAGAGHIFDVSRGGCAIESDMSAAKGDPISLNLTIATQPAPILIDLGTVRWATRREFGVEFMVVNGASKQRLNEYLIHVAKQGIPGS